MRVSRNYTFLEIAEQAFVDYDKLKAELMDEETFVDGTEEQIEKAEALDKIYIKVIVFLAMYLEAYIWDCGATYMGEKVMERLDKLGPLDKWVIIPRMVLGKPFPIKPHHQGYLKALFQERNALIHHKSIDIRPFVGKLTPEEKYPKGLIEFWDRIDLHQYFEVMRYLTSTLNEEIESNKKWL
uniref:hypothetical protein n=1 Tax=Pedobacter schmidteae TaxID=2201271 RepID=UPI000EAE50FA|nr:hypothetical protein [Pedobacter schmidteae]